MKQKTIIIIIFILVFILIVLIGWFISQIITIKFANPEDLKLTITPEKEIINKTENKSLIVNIELINVVDDNLYIYYDFSINGILEFKITTPSNNTIYPVHPHTDFTEKYLYGNVTLYKSESINTTVDIFDYEYSLDQREDNSGLYDWNETGKYKIQFEYDNFGKGEIIESNVIEFWLKE